MVEFSIPFDATFPNEFKETVRYEFKTLTPEMMRDGVGQGSEAIDDEAIRMAVNESQEGWAVYFPGNYWCAGNVQYSGRRLFYGNGASGSLAQPNIKLVGGVNVKGVFTPVSWFTSNQATMQTVAQATKFRPTFRDLYIDGSSDLGSVCNGIVFSSTEGFFDHLKFVNCSGYSILGTPFNQNGDAQNGGSNMVQNRIMNIRSSGAGLGPIRTDDGASETRMTDGIVQHASLTNGTEAAVRIDAAQGWGLGDIQTSSTMHGVFCLKTNVTTINNIRVNAYGNSTTLGNRYGVYAGGLTVAQAMVTVSNCAIEANYNSTAGAGASSWISIGFGGRTPASGKKSIVITGNTFSNTGFNGTTGKQSGIGQLNDTDNAVNIVASGNIFMSDQNANGSWTDVPIQLQGTAKATLTSNRNGPAAMADAITP